jgi:hypothetical protein
MDEITLVNLLNKICEHAPRLDWKLNCDYNDGNKTTIMKAILFDKSSRKRKGALIFRLETAMIISGTYKSLMPFSQKVTVVDALLDILHYETTTTIPSYN